jgi:hypothetical protein
MKKWIWTGVTPVLGAGLVMALVGAVVGIHNPITPHAPTGCEGGLIGGALGLLLGALLVGVCGWQDRALARGLGGAVFGAVLGLIFGLRGPGFAVPAGLLGTLAGTLVGSSFYLLVRSRILLGVLAGVWAAGVANPERYAPATDASRPLAELAWDQAQVPEADDDNFSVDITPQPIGLIPPGTVVGDRPPPDWSHLVLKTRFNVVAGAVDKLPSGLLDGVGAVFTALLARVEVVPGVAGPRHRLAGLATGAGTSIAGQDTILSTATRSKLRADLGFFGWMTLAHHEKRWPTILIRARSNTLAVFDDPTSLHRDGGHHPVVLRYALLVEPRTGRLETLVWRVDGDPAGGYQGAVGPLEWLPANQIGCCRLHSVSQFPLGLAGSPSLAILNLPTGHTQIPIPDRLREVLGLLQLTPAQARELEKGLRNLVFSRPPDPKTVRKTS